MSTQQGNQGETNLSAGGSDANAGAAGRMGSSALGESGAQGSQASDSNRGSEGSDYGSQRYGGSLYKHEGGDGYDIDEGREGSAGRGQSPMRGARKGSRRRGGYSLGDTGNTGLMLLAGMITGATLMYFLDPQQGGRRRALLRDKLVRYSNDTADVLGKTSRDLSNRVQGLVAETTKAIGLGGREVGNATGGNAEA